MYVSSRHTQYINVTPAFIFTCKAICICSFTEPNFLELKDEELFVHAIRISKSIVNCSHLHKTY